MGGRIMENNIYTPKKYPWYKELWWDIKYYCWNIPSEWYYNVKWFFGNLWRFRKILWNYRTWDFSYCNELFAESLEWLAHTIENGHEEQRSANKKAKKIKELVKLLRKLTDASDFDTWENPKYWKGNKLLIPTDKLADIQRIRMEDTLVKILCIIKGQHPNDIEHSMADNYDEYVKEFDGTGYYGWWD